MTALDDTPVRDAPHDPLAEANLVGALIVSARARQEVLGGHMVRASDLYDPRLETVFDAVVALDERGAPVDVPLVVAELTTRGELARAGGPVGVFDLAANLASAENATYYARVVRERSVLRDLVRAGSRITQMGQTAEGGDAEKILAAAREELDSVRGVGNESREPSVAELADDLMRSLYDDGPDLSTRWDWPWLDFREGPDGSPFVLPAKPGQVIVIGGRPGMGKSTALAALIRQWCIHDDACAVLWTKEMPGRQWLERIASAEARVSLKRIKTRTLDPDELYRVQRAMERIASAPLHIRREGGTLADCRAAVRAHKADILGYDYLQLAPVGGRASERQVNLGTFVQGLKDLGGDENCVIATAAQLNRGGGASGKVAPPTMENFRETGVIENVADVGILIHREDAYEKESPRAGEADFIVAKQRDGETGSVVLAAQLHYARFVDMAN